MPGTTISARSAVHNLSAGHFLRLEWNKMVQDLGAVTFNAGALAITGGGATTAKTVNAVEYIINGVIARLAAANMPALAGTITQNNFGGWVFTVTSGGVVSARFMTQAATLATVAMPVIPLTDCVIGYVRLNPTAANFVGATTALDAANTNAIYVDTPGCTVSSLSSGGSTAPAQITSWVG